MNVWTLSELAEAAGLRYRNAHDWLERGVIRASIRPRQGSGREVLFSDDDVIDAVLIAATRRVTSLEVLGEAVRRSNSQPVSEDT